MPFSFKNQMMQESIGPLPVDSSCIEQMDEMDTSNHTIANITQQLNLSKKKKHKKNKTQLIDFASIDH